MKVTHNIERARFEIQVEDATAVLDYDLADGLMTITHTFVPPELRGQSIAGQLAKAAFQYAQTQSLKVIPECSYIGVYARRHSKVQRLLV